MKGCHAGGPFVRSRRYGVGSETAPVRPASGHTPCGPSVCSLLALASTATERVALPRRFLMPFPDAVRICLQRKYVDFTGRARRSEYWFFFLVTVLAGIVGGILDGLFGWRGGPYGGTGPI